MTDAKTRSEQFLAGAAGENITLPEPITREEKFLAKAAGLDVTTLEPITRRELFLSKLGGSSGGDTPSGENKLAKFVERTVTEITAEDLKGCTMIGGYAFKNCDKLTSIIIGNSIITIGPHAFSGCEKLTSIIIPNSVKTIDTAAFSYCISMQYYDFTSHTSVPTLANVNAFSAIPSTCEIRVPMALVDEWKAATNWSNHASKIVGV